MQGRAVRLRNLRKVFPSRDGGTEAVAGVELDVADGEFFAMLGPSGSGKTTVLRMIAGFETPTSGSVELGGKDVTALAPFERDVHTVFQDYALFPHMTVEQNVAYALKVRRVPKARRLREAAEALERVRLSGFGRRRPSQLSGGQRQRVALARALVGRPRVLLLDEPLGALDLKLREQMQLELKALQRDVGITFVYVTHDQDEALTMSDRIAVFRDGRVEQTGTPAEIYERPASPFVADFVGTSNLLAGATAEHVVGGRGPFSVRPEKIRVRREREGPGQPPGPAADSRSGRGPATYSDSDSDSDSDSGSGSGSDSGSGPGGGSGPCSDHSTVAGTVAEVVYLGGATRFLVDLDTGGRLTAVQQNLEASSEDVAAYRGARVVLQWHRRHNVPVGDRHDVPLAGRINDPVGEGS